MDLASTTFAACTATTVAILTWGGDTDGKPTLPVVVWNQVGRGPAHQVPASLSQFTARPSLSYLHTRSRQPHPRGTAPWPGSSRCSAPNGKQNQQFDNMELELTVCSPDLFWQGKALLRAHDGTVYLHAAPSGAATSLALDAKGLALFSLPGKQLLLRVSQDSRILAVAETNGPGRLHMYDLHALVVSRARIWVSGSVRAARAGHPR
jgi:hypothetical protein